MKKKTPSYIKIPNPTLPGIFDDFPINRKARRIHFKTTGKLIKATAKPVKKINGEYWRTK